MVSLSSIFHFHDFISCLLILVINTVSKGRITALVQDSLKERKGEFEALEEGDKIIVDEELLKIFKQSPFFAGTFYFFSLFLPFSFHKKQTRKDNSITG